MFGKSEDLQKELIDSVAKSLEKRVAEACTT